MLSETPIFCSRQSILRYVGKPPLSFKNLLHALPVYKFELFLSHICKQTTCQQSLLCLDCIKFSNKVLLQGIMCLAVNFLFPLLPLLSSLFSSVYSSSSLSSSISSSTISSSSLSVSLWYSSIFLHFAPLTFWRSLHFFCWFFFKFLFVFFFLFHFHFF